MSISDFMNNGNVFINGKEVRTISNITWDKHPKFDGVFTKNIFVGTESNNINAMVIRIEPNHETGMHNHEGKYELHKIIDGNGEAIIDNTKVQYLPGVVSLI